ncbi:hypothetical protein NDU88_001428 [Pleurodeles waltl]|uniref:Uncharacterized protein n=1 Tax=Pleurodeles waltl TaxID=8319 RepID=A0AAV7VWF2_PLEWA|nr:hypothetical protein NDU88_001428 [Pleurodeles waltl]
MRGPYCEWHNQQAEEPSLSPIAARRRIPVFIWKHHPSLHKLVNTIYPAHSEHAGKHSAVAPPAAVPCGRQADRASSTVLDQQQNANHVATEHQNSRKNEETDVAPHKAGAVSCCLASPPLDAEYALRATPMSRGQNVGQHGRTTADWDCGV